jgi:hypothetical protein
MNQNNKPMATTPIKRTVNLPDDLLDRLPADVARRLVELLLQIVADGQRRKEASALSPEFLADAPGQAQNGSAK